MNKAMLRKLLNFIFFAKLYSSSQGQHLQRNIYFLFRVEWNSHFLQLVRLTLVSVFQKIGDLK